MIIVPLRSWVSENHDIVANATSLVGTTAVTLTLGFFYWWLAARLFPPTAVGLAAAAISAMMLLGNVGTVGLGTMLIGELPRQPSNAGALITTSLVIAGTASGLLGILFVIIAPHLSAELSPLTKNVQSFLLFALGVSFTGAVQVLDQAMIGLLRGRLQLWRNAIFATVKIVALVIVGIWFTNKVGLTIYGTWIVGIAASLIIMAVVFSINGVQILYRPQLNIFQKQWSAALRHHALNIALLLPSFGLPVVVTILLSASTNAFFYVAWMIASLAYVAANALSTVLYAISSADSSILVSPKIRVTLKLSFFIGLLGSFFLIISARFLLKLFGDIYAVQAAWSLRILALGVFPMIIKVHYVAVCRIQGQIIQAAKTILVFSLLELVLAGFGARVGGLSGLSLGWLVGLCVEAIFLTPVVISVAFPNKTGSMVTKEREDQPLSRMDSPKDKSNILGR